MKVVSPSTINATYSLLMSGTGPFVVEGYPGTFNATITMSQQWISAGNYTIPSSKWMIQRDGWDFMSYVASGPGNHGVHVGSARGAATAFCAKIV